jgi:hypothetical protein
MMTRAKRILGVLLGLGLVAGLLLAPLPVSWQGPWQGRLLDLGHVPLFAALTVLLWASLRPGLFWPVVIAAAAAGLGEVFQTWVPNRTGNFFDFLRGALGALAAAAGIRAWQARGRPLRAGSYLLLLAGLVAWPLLDAAPYLADAYQGARAFPTLADFHTERQLLRWDSRQAALARTADPQDSGTPVGRLDFFPGPDPYSAESMHPVIRDFTAYRWLCCSFRVEGEPLELTTKVRSGPGAWGGSTHYQEEGRYAAGEHVFRLDLTAVAPKARPRPLDLSDVSTVQLFVIRPETTRTVYLRRIWLEK